MANLAALYLRLLKVILLILAVAMVSTVFMNFVLRYGFSSGIAVADELARVAMVWSGFVGASIAFVEKRHLSVRFIVDRLAAGAATLTVALAQLACLALSVVLAMGTWKLVTLNIDVYLPLTKVSQGLAIYGPGFFFAINVSVIIALQFIDTLKNQRVTWQEH